MLVWCVEEPLQVRCDIDPLHHTDGTALVHHIRLALNECYGTFQRFEGLASRMSAWKRFMLRKGLSPASKTIPILSFCRTY